MTILPNGEFAVTIQADELARGLRPSAKNPRNSKFLTNCEGAVGIDNVLSVLHDLTDDAVDLTAILPLTFPYPQLFVFPNVIVLCTETDIYEIEAGALSVSLLTVTAGILWSGISVGEFVYMSNGKVAVVRSAGSQEWSITTDYPIAGAICNLNGQVMIGAPGVEQ